MIRQIERSVFAVFLIGTLSCDVATFEGKSSISKADQEKKSEETATDNNIDDDADDVEVDDSASKVDKKTGGNAKSDVDSLPPAESLGKFYFKVGSAKADDRYFLSGLSKINSEGDPSSGYNFLSICQWNDDESNWDTYTWSGADAGSLSNQIIKGFGYKAASYLVSSGNDPTDKVFCEPNAGPLGWENVQNPSPASPLYSSTWLDFGGYITTKGQARRWVANRYVAPLAEPCALLENQPEELTTRLRDILAKKVPTASKKTDQAICNLDGI
jgi:hypothetical protein